MLDRSPAHSDRRSSGTAVGDGSVADAARTGLAVAIEIGDEFVARMCRTWLAYALHSGGRLEEATDLFDGVVSDAEAAGDPVWSVLAMLGVSQTLAYEGDGVEAMSVLQAADVVAARAGTTTCSP